MRSRTGGWVEGWGQGRIPGKGGPLVSKQLCPQNPCVAQAGQEPRQVT